MVEDIDLAAINLVEDIDLAAIASSSLGLLRGKT